MEPTSFTVKEDSAFKAGESEFTKTKLMTRLTYTLDGMTGSFKVGSDGSVAIQERDGLDARTVTECMAEAGLLLVQAVRAVQPGAFDPARLGILSGWH